MIAKMAYIGRETVRKQQQTKLFMRYVYVLVQFDPLFQAHYHTLPSDTPKVKLSLSQGKP